MNTIINIYLLLDLVPSHLELELNGDHMLEMISKEMIYKT